MSHSKVCFGGLGSLLLTGLPVLVLEGGVDTGGIYFD